MEISSVDCPKCGGSISDQIRQGKLFKCSNCGSTLVWPESQSKLVLSFGLRLCPECGIDNEQSRNFCRNCGSVLIKTCSVCNESFYVGDKFCPNGHDYEYERQKSEEKKKQDVEFYLQEAKICTSNGNIEQAEQILEEALSVNLEWAPLIAGFPRSPQQIKPVSGYALLVHLSGKSGKKQSAVQYFKRMLQLNPTYPGDSFARQAAREAKIEREAKVIANEMGVSWTSWE